MAARPIKYSLRQGSAAALPTGPIAYYQDRFELLSNRVRVPLLAKHIYQKNQEKPIHTAPAKPIGYQGIDPGSVMARSMDLRQCVWADRSQTSTRLSAWSSLTRTCIMSSVLLMDSIS
jgi:hypothetical protein